MARIGPAGTTPRAALLLSMFSIAACRPAGATQVIVTLRADETIGPDVSSVDVEISSGSTSTEEILQRYPDLDAPPLDITLVPLGGDATRRFEVFAIARDSRETPLGAVRLSGGWVAGETRRYDLWFTEACRGVLCARPLSCVQGQCVDPTVPVDAGLDAAREDGWAATDAGVDARQEPADSAGPPPDAFVCACDDGLACNGPETCSSGAACSPGEPIRCVPRSCESMICSEPAGTCVATAIDLDGDGFGAVPCGADCDDARMEVSPVAAEVCNGRDDDCDTAIDECPDGAQVCGRVPARCVTPICGDGVVDVGELCDGGPAPGSPTDNCAADCQVDECEAPFDLDGVPPTGGWIRRTVDFAGAGNNAYSCSAIIDGPDRIFVVTATGPTLEIDAGSASGGFASTHVRVWRGCRGTEIGCGRTGEGGAPLSVSGLTVGERIHILIDSLEIVDHRRNLLVRFVP